MLVNFRIAFAVQKLRIMFQNRLTYPVKLNYDIHNKKRINNLQRIYAMIFIHLFIIGIIQVRIESCLSRFLRNLGYFQSVLTKEIKTIKVTEVFQ